MAQIDCPHCGNTIDLDETLAGPLIAKVQIEANARVKKAEEECERQLAESKAKANELALKEKDLTDKEANFQASLNLKLAEERQKIEDAARINARAEVAPTIEAERKAKLDLQRQLEAAQTAELTLRNEKDALEQRAKALDLEVARKVDEQRKGLYDNAVKEAEERNRLRLAEKDKTIADMQLKIEEAQRKGTQGSQQLQGEVLELDFESILRQFFPQDTIESVKTGSRGGDLLQRVLGEMGRSSGTIFWELKRAQTWGGDWCTKAKQDAADAKAEVAIIVSEVLPKGVSEFGPYDGIWVARPTHAVMLGVALRQGVLSGADARQGTIGRETKAERLYEYMIGPEFRATLEGIALPFRELHDELLAEKRTTMARWRRQEKRIDRVLASVAGLQGDLQGIAGSEMPELPGFESEGSTSPNEAQGGELS